MWLPPWRMKSMLGAFPAGYPKEYAEDIAAQAAWRDRRDEAPFKALFQRYARGLYLYIFFNIRYFGKEDVRRPVKSYDGKDYTLPYSPEAIRLLNKTYYNALRGLNDFRREVSMGTWLHTIAHNVVVDAAKFSSRNPLLAKERRGIEALSTSKDGAELEQQVDTKTTAEQAMVAAGRRTEGASIIAMVAAARRKDGTPLLPPDVIRDAGVILKFPEDIDSIARVLRLSVQDAEARVDEVTAAVAAVAASPEFAEIRRSQK